MTQKLYFIIALLCALAGTASAQRNVTYTFSGNTDGLGNASLTVTATGSASATGTATDGWSASDTQRTIDVPGDVTLTFGTNQTSQGLYVDNTNGLVITGSGATGGYITLNNDANKSNFIYHITLKDRNDNPIVDAWNWGTSYTFRFQQAAIKTIAVTYNSKLLLSDAEISGIADEYIVSNTAVAPVPTLSWHGTTLTEGTHYTLSYTDNTAAGTARVTATGKGDFSPGFTKSATYTLRWATYTVRFHKNDGGDPEATTDQAFYYTEEKALTANTFDRTGYTFSGWSTTENGSVTYADGQSVSNLTATNGATVDLYAQWTPNTYTVTLDNQSATTSGSTSTTATYDAAMPAITLPTRTGYTFGGYYTAANGGGTKYYNADGTSASNWNIAEATTLYAQWTAHTYTLRLHHNDGTDGYTDMAMTYDVAANIQNVSRTGYVYDHWTTNADGTGTSYAAGQEVTNLSATQGDVINLYAQWTNPTGTCGDNATWEYNHANRTLTISGRGEVTAGYSTCPWADYKTYITTLDIGSDITSISHSLFNGHSALTTITGGEGLIYVQPGIFSGAPWEIAAEASTTVVYLGKVAYCGRGVSGDVTIQNGTVSIAEDAFKNNTNLTSITIPASVATIYPLAFYSCDSLTTVNVLADTPPTLGFYAFRLSGENRSLDRTFNVRSAAYKTTGEWADIYNKKNDYSFHNFTMRVISTLTLPDGVTATAAADKVTAYGTDYYAEGATITLSGLGEEYTTGGVTYRSRATVTYNTDQTLTANADATGQATFTMPATDATVTTEDYAYAVKYIDEDGTEQTCTNFTLIESSDGDVTLGNWQNQENWYVVSGDVTISGRLRFDDKTVHLILCDGAEISVTSNNNNGIYIGSSLTIYGQSGQSGILTAQSNSSYDYGINIHNLTVNGGTVNAIGYFGIYCYDITINRGNVTVTGEEYGIRNNGFVTINGGTVSANGTNSWMGIGISDTFDNDDAVTINGGIVSVNGGFCGIDAAGTHINGGIVNATGTRSNGISGHIILGWTSATDRITVSRYGGFVSVKDGQALWTGSGNSALAGNVSQDQRAALAGVELQPLVDALVLHDDDSALPTEQKNTALIVAAAKAGGSRNVVLEGRTFYRDGDWNTLCLPFFIDGDDIQSNAYNPLYGATIMGFSVELYYGPNGKKYIIDNNQYYEVPGYKLADPDPAPLHRSGQVENGKLYLYFEEENSPGGKTYSVNNDVPLILKWGTTDNHPTTDIVNPVFQGVTIPNKYADYGIFGNSLSSFEGPNNVFFQGTFSSTGIYADPAVNLYLGAANTLYWPNTDGYNIGAFRAYFALYNGLTCGGSNSQVRAFNLAFGEGSEETGIVSISKESRSEGVAGAWYDLNGRRLSGKPTARGIYIHGGRKVVIP